jgi:hypothetical protein
MGKYKDQNGTTKIGDWLRKTAPHLVDVVGEVLPEKGALGIVKNLIQKDEVLTPEQKKEGLEIADKDLEAFELEVKDREGGRDLYKNDSLVQKIFAITFLIGYGGLSWYLLSILMGTSEMPKLAETMITMIWTGTSTKLSTIIDFFFGGSVK